MHCAGTTELAGHAELGRDAPQGAALRRPEHRRAARVTARGAGRHRARGVLGQRGAGGAGHHYYPIEWTEISSRAFLA
jgi:hypothetical protein